MLDWDDVRYVLALERGGTLARAARTLKTNATTVGRRLAQLEEKLGVKLFDRTTRGYEPTAAGARFLPHAERMESEALALARLAVADDPREVGTVHVTTTEAIAARHLTPHLPRLRELHPGIDLVVTCAERKLDLGRREADIAIRLARPQEPDLVARRLVRIELALYASHAYLARRGRPGLDPACWAEHDILMFLAGRGSLPENAWFEANCPGARVVLRCNSVGLLADATAEGIGCSLLPCAVADRDPRLARLESPQPPASRDAWLAYHRDIEPSARVRTVIDFLMHAIAE